MEMKKTIDASFAKMGGTKAAQTKAKTELKGKVDENEKKTLKEIKDVEEILK